MRALNISPYLYGYIFLGVAKYIVQKLTKFADDINAFF
jgi:hypothetical protein